MTSPSTIRSVNWHLISSCNYACRFCFAQNLGEAPVPYAEGVEILTRLAESGMDKINFAGGEPLLHPQLFDYCREAHGLGMTVSITTNGSLLSDDLVHAHSNYIDWIALSVDSAFEHIEERLGRGRGGHVRHAIQTADAIRDAGIRLKVNTTVTSLSWTEDMTGFINRTSPDRWKVLQMLHIRGENDDAVDDLSVTHGQFQAFINRHSDLVLRNGVKPVFESADMIESSYFMVTPGGMVKTDTDRIIRKYPLDDVLQYGVSEYVSEGQYIGRGGVYEW
ncbi:viperin family antiviral radical SAM protein [Methanogenium organophilum]|uniref:Viperin family antiviral radical SAM protein n=1 Tax=Methanogenium organophilum TaxID=2199 RepID=A0A9X9S304_METOG|nr:viperin family antiviral radical SAM protein [Methanogenium organophilum]WAI00949.1 viperin family antiviral radical SAM protein [Methanogenium organophilum]